MRNRPFYYVHLPIYFEVRRQLRSAMMVIVQSSAARRDHFLWRLLQNGTGIHRPATASSGGRPLVSAVLTLCVQDHGSPRDLGVARRP